MTRDELLDLVRLFVAGDDDVLDAITNHFTSILIETRRQIIEDAGLEESSPMESEDLAEMARNIGTIMYGFRQRILEIEDEDELEHNLLWQFERIFVDQTARAMNAGELFGYIFIENVTGIGNMAKIWISRLTQNTCIVCETLHGTRIPLQSDFLSLGQTLSLPNGTFFRQTYGNLSAPTVHPHCQCTLEFTTI